MSEVVDVFRDEDLRVVAQSLIYRLAMSMIHLSLMEQIIAFAVEYLFIAILLIEGCYLVVVHRNHWRTLLVSALVIGGIGFLISLIANRIIEDPRPFVAQGFRPLIHSSSDNGFPSDHTLLLGTSAAVVMIANRRAGLLALLAAILVGLARVYFGVHHFADIAGSLVIVGTAAAIYAGFRRIIKLRQRRVG